MLVLLLSSDRMAAQDVLPFAASPMGGKAGPTMQQSVHKWRERPRHLPKNAPNILSVMLNDAGFGQASTFGGEINTPTLSRPAKQVANDWDGYTGVIPKSSATLAEVLRHYGYATAAFGKDHNTPVDQPANEPYDSSRSFAQSIDRHPMKFGEIPTAGTPFVTTPKRVPAPRRAFECQKERKKKETDE